MSGSIRVSEKHGVNPALGVCFWCGKEDGTVILVGRLPNDAEAPRYVTASYEPCAACQAKMALGVTLVEATDRANHPGQPPIQERNARTPALYPTGVWVVITRDATMRLFQPVELAKQILTLGKVYLEPDAMQQIQEKYTAAMQQQD